MVSWYNEWVLSLVSCKVFQQPWKNCGYLGGHLSNTVNRQSETTLNSENLSTSLLRNPIPNNNWTALPKLPSSWKNQKETCENREGGFHPQREKKLLSSYDSDPVFTFTFHF